MNNIESFYEHLIVLRTKGNILPIRIKVEITDLSWYDIHGQRNKDYPAGASERNLSGFPIERREFLTRDVKEARLMMLLFSTA